MPSKVALRGGRLAAQSPQFISTLGGGREVLVGGLGGERDGGGVAYLTQMLSEMPSHVGSVVFIRAGSLVILTMALTVALRGG